MTLTFIDSWTTPPPLGDWPLSGTPNFANSRAYEIFLRELRRYTLEEVGGRSFLIAGHRGAGKTAMVTQALRQLTTEMLQASINPTTKTVSRRGRLQRPLIVSLNAQSLITPPEPKTSPKPKPKVAGKEDDETEAAEDDVTAKDKPFDEVGSALVHITIALYRALAREIARGFSIHARSGDTDGRPDRAELGAQLLLDLDDAPEPALLRRKWQQLNRLAGGILWPERADGTLVANAIIDQGLREIVAITTAAQAFQVVSGDVTDKVKSVNSATHDRETKSSLDVKDMIGRLGAVFAGTIAGGTALASPQGGAPLAVGLGLLVWLGSSFALGTTASSKAHRERSRDYTFLRDRSIQTLDRELPQVIERIREAGLAPVFVLDELDKLDDPQATIALIINRLKHIVSDFSFFCFLANRDYYDSLERQVTVEAYPSEHTYFSERLFILNRPSDLFDYVVQLVRSDAAEANEENLPRATLALVAIYRSKLNFTDLMRELNRFARPDSSLTVSAQQLRQRRDLRLVAAMQLAFDESVRIEPFATRFANDESLAQLATDALYYLPRSWEADPATPVDMSDEVLKAYLIDRSLCRTKASHTPPAQPPADVPPADGPKPAPVNHGTPANSGNGGDDPSKAGYAGQAPAAGATNSVISPPDFELVRQIVGRQVEFLLDWKKLADALRDRPRPDIWRLDEIVPIEIGSPLLAPIPDQPNKYQFLIDEAGSVRAAHDHRTSANSDPDPNQTPAPNSVPPTVNTPDSKTLVATERGELLDLMQAFDRLLATSDVSLDALVRVGFMPATITSAALANAERDLLDAAPSSDLLDPALAMGRLLRQALAERRRLLAYILYALVEFRASIPDPKPPAADTLAILARYFPPAGRDTSTDTLSGFAQIVRNLPGNIVADIENSVLTSAIGVRALSNMLLNRRGRLATAPRPVPTDSEIAAAWNRWQKRLVKWFDQGNGIALPVDPVDVTTAVREEIPGRLFRSDLAAMTMIDWSRVVLAGLPLQEESAEATAPLWICFAGLRALGFDATTLARLASSAADDMSISIPPDDRRIIDRIIERAPPNQPQGLLFLAASANEPILASEDSAGQPILTVASNDYPRYERGLDWLAAAEAFEGIVDEEK